MRKHASIIGLAVGLLVAPIAIFLAIASAGAGHGHYLAAKICFPITMASAYALGVIAPPFMLVAIVQYPIYGWLIGGAVNGKRMRITTAVLAMVHCCLAFLVVVFPPEYFS